ncbi:MAG TPA: alpha-glucuronidase family glycosyl hydrolase, partial [Bryobacteraceae bacterium]|nr:alpha-glucuronidase family glycosyl hydrolase [Bryobacteraceae bacterium]
MRPRQMFLFLVTLTLATSLAAETGYDGWLRYAEIDDAGVRQRYTSLPAAVVILGDSPVLRAAQGELIRGVRGMLGRTLRIESRLPGESAIVLGTLDAVGKALPAIRPSGGLAAEGYWLKTAAAGGVGHLVIAGADDRGVLYGTFALLGKIGLHQPVSSLDEKQVPYAPVRWVNEWNNLDGTIERGYAGLSIFFEDNNVRSDLGRVRDYARLLASLGINGCTINNVNANPRAITTEFIPQLVRVAEVFRPWGVRLSLSLDFSSPRSIGGLDTFDPLDARVIQWWKDKVDEIYRAIPDFGGFVIKADSEGRLGPSAYGRTHADATNVVARPLKAHGGLLFYRGFVYDHKMDWRNLKNDRARAAYDNFKPLDGQFEDNALIQIKNGPIDFQVREPASPLFGALEKTSQAIELQITQEYLGQQRQLCYLVPMWKETLDFDLQAKGPGTPVKALVAGKVFGRPTGGFVGVSNVGLDANWLGHHLAMANLHGYGRLAWNPDLSAREIVEEWTRLTFGHDQRVVDTIVAMQLSSWRTHENYTGPLGAQSLTDIVGPHYGPAVEASERNGWGQWHR